MQPTAPQLDCPCSCCLPQPEEAHDRHLRLRLRQGLRKRLRLLRALKALLVATPVHVRKLRQLPLQQ